MENFSYRVETEVIFGKDSELQVGAKTKPFASKVLLHYGGGSIKKSGLYDRIIASLQAEGIEIIELANVQPNPRISLVREGIELCRKEQIDFILAVGGGSVIDSAKGIAAGVHYEGDVWDLCEGTKINHPLLKIGVVLTIPAAGSETSSGTVLSNEALGLKKSFGHPKLQPYFSILNPELTYTLPDYQSACGVSDMLAHVLERYFCVNSHNELTDHLCEATMKTILYQGKKVLEQPRDYDTRAEVMLAGMVAHNSSLSMGRLSVWTTHGIEHELSAINDIAHGAGLAIIFPAYITFMLPHATTKIAQLAHRVFEVEYNIEDPMETAKEGIRRLVAFYRQIGLPTTLKEGGFTEDMFDHIASTFVRNHGTKADLVPIGYDEVIAILEYANQTI